MDDIRQESSNEDLTRFISNNRIKKSQNIMKMVAGQK